MSEINPELQKPWTWWEKAFGIPAMIVMALVFIGSVGLVIYTGGVAP